MAKVSTHLHAVLRLSKKIEIVDLDLFYLENVYPDCLFHMWIDNYMLSVDMGDISMYDQMICDMEVILPIIQELQGKEYVGREKEALEKILALASEPVPLYLVPKYKKEKYIEILDGAVEAFIEEVYYFRLNCVVK